MLKREYAYSIISIFILFWKFRLWSKLLVDDRRFFSRCGESSISYLALVSVAFITAKTSPDLPESSKIDLLLGEKRHCEGNYLVQEHNTMALTRSSDPRGETAI